MTLALVPGRAAAQLLEGPVSNLSGGLDPSGGIASGRDGAVLALGSFNGSPTLATQRFPNGMVAPSAAIALPDSNELGPALSALAHGGFVAAWLGPVFIPGESAPEFQIVTQRLSSTGEPTGLPIPASGPVNAPGFPGIAAAGDGFVVGWQQNERMLGRRFDSTGTPIGGTFDGGVEDEGDTRIATVPGGFLMAWGRNGGTEAHLYDTNAVPVGPRFVVATSFRMTGLAANASGTLAVIVGRPHDGDPSPNEIRARFFAPDGSFVGDDVVVDASDPGVAPSVASGPAGNFLIVWGRRIHARAYDANGVALGPTRELSTLSTSGTIGVAGRHDGGFFLFWRDGSVRSHAARVTLCTPGSAVCGDGTLVSTCEVCDAGTANSDTQPDACRTDCRPARCGDGVADGGEQCDDGDHENCDGCDEFCDLEAGTVCGDGVRAPIGCSEQCDDANAAGGDGCSERCGIERVLGGGKTTTDCYAAWRVANTSNEPRFAKKGGINPRQSCRDGDPSCDFDAGVPGSCTFHVAVCVNNSEPSECAPARLRSWTLASPNAKQAAGRPALAAIRAAFDAVVPSSVVGPGDLDLCSPDAAVVVPLRGAPGAFKSGKQKLKARAEVYSGALDGDSLELRCDP